MENFKSRLDREIDYTKPVKIYRNLNNGLISIQQNNLIVGYSDEICLKECSYPINETLRQKVIANKSKNVHAFIKGYLELDKAIADNIKENGLQATYNPYKYDSFVYKEDTNRKLENSSYCVLNKSGYLLVSVN